MGEGFPGPYPEQQMLLSHVQLFAIPGTVAHQAPPSLGILQARALLKVQHIY